MPDLSPAAASIVKAFDDRYEVLGPFDDNWQELCIAAALRAAEEHLFLDRRDKSPLGALISCSEQLLAIATELEAS